MAKRFNKTGSANVVKFDQDRAKATRLRSQGTASDASTSVLGSFAKGKAFNIAVTSQAVSYVMEVGRLFSVIVRFLTECSGSHRYTANIV